MPRNIEIKARLVSIDTVLPAVERLAEHGPDILRQEDTFFPCPNGRLKLRAFSVDHGELIFYRRPDQPGPKQSEYCISPTTAPGALRETLARAYGVSGTVRKVRTLYRIGRTRVHLDEVEGLGSFLELEVVLSAHESTAEGEAVAHALMQQLGIHADDLVHGAYVDLLP